MSTSSRFVTSALACVSAIALTAAAAPQLPSTAAAGAAPSRADNYYGAGNHVGLATPMDADVVVAGRRIDITQRVGGDLLAAGWDVRVSGRADDDVRIAGASIAIDAPVAGDVTVAGGDVTLGAQTRVGGRSWITGRSVRLAGTFDRELQVAGATVEISGEARQPVRVVAERLEILPGAKILAGLSYKSPVEARIADGAAVTGPITFDRIAKSDARKARELPVGSSLLFAVHLFLGGLLVLALVPRIETSVVETLRARPWRSLLAGFVLLVTTPVAALVLVVSVLALPLGLALAAAYAIALFVGALATAFCIGDVEARMFNAAPAASSRQRVVLLAAGVATLAVLRSVAGGGIVLAAILFGLGAVALRAYDAYASPAAAPA